MPVTYIWRINQSKQTTMKKLAFILALGAICISSCKKSYTCTCTTTTTIGGSTITTPNVTIIPDATQQQAQTICLAGEVYSQGGSQNTKCHL
jgi:hypothetical protein